MLPKEVLYRSKKGFGAPIGAWFKEGLLDIQLSEARVAHIDMGKVSQMMEAHRKNQVDHRAFLWNYWLLRFFNMQNG